MSEYKLMSCPFCGYVGEIELIPGMFARCEMEKTFAINCDCCSAIGPDSKTMLGAIKKWNNQSGKYPNDDY